jgi:hypothetical protein
MVPNEVFHYTTNCKALKILIGKQLRLGQLEFTNDPKESKLWVGSLAILGVVDQNTGKAIGEVQREINRIKSKEWKVLCVSKNHPEIDNIPLADREIKKLSLPAFMSGDCLPRMWASYASENNKHTGVCLKLRGDKLDQRIMEKFRNGYKVFRGNIEYDDEKFFNRPKWMIEISQNEKERSQKLREHLIKHYEYYFLLKSQDWQTENEFRWLIHNEEDQPEYISIDKIIEAVILGADISKDDEGCIRKLCQGLSIEVIRMGWVNGIPEYR